MRKEWRDFIPLVCWLIVLSLIAWIFLHFCYPVETGRWIDPQNYNSRADGGGVRWFPDEHQTELSRLFRGLGFAVAVFSAIGAAGVFLAIVFALIEKYS